MPHLSGNRYLNPHSTYQRLPIGSLISWVSCLDCSDPPSVKDARRGCTHKPPETDRSAIKHWRWLHSQSPPHWRQEPDHSDLDKTNNSIKDWLLLAVRRDPSSLPTWCYGFDWITSTQHTSSDCHQTRQNERSGLTIWWPFTVDRTQSRPVVMQPVRWKWASQWSDWYWKSAFGVEHF